MCRNVERSQRGNGRIKKLSEDGGRYVQPSYVLFLDMALKAGLSPADIEEWTPGMVVDLVFFRANEQNRGEQLPPPTQAQFDDF